MKSEVWTLRGFVVAVQLRSGALLVVEWTRDDRYDVCELEDVKGLARVETYPSTMHGNFEETVHIITPLETGVRAEIVAESYDQPLEVLELVWDGKKWKVLTEVEE